MTQVTESLMPGDVKTGADALPWSEAMFDALRLEGCIYVDKTAQVELLARQKSFFCLTRPRRFGKSLLVSTLESLFAFGLRDFKGLAIEKSWTDRTYPVVHLDFSRLRDVDTIEAFDRQFKDCLLGEFVRVGFHYDADSVLLFASQLRNWLRSLPVKSLVILVDEYDAPLVAALDRPELFTAILNRCQSFYSLLKEVSGRLRFLFLTGVTKFQNTDLFSTGNFITDISFDPAYGTLLGWTCDEIETYFGNYLDRAQRALGLTREALLKKLECWYDGYVFEETGQQRVFNPWSVLSFFRSRTFGFENFWYTSSGQPQLLRKYVESHSLGTTANYWSTVPVLLSDLKEPQSLTTMTPGILLTQAGYLTIRSVTENGVCYLGCPNEEVAQSLARLITDIALKNPAGVIGSMAQLPRKLASGTINDVVPLFNAAFANLNYKTFPVENEAACRAILQTLLIGANLLPAVEVHNFLGRSDLEVEAGGRHWVFEFKFLRSPRGGSEEIAAAKLLDAAQQQILSRRYGEGCLSARQIMRAVLVFSRRERQFVAWRMVGDKVGVLAKS